MEYEQPDLESRDVRQSLKRGFSGKCPRCGKGHLLHSYLKVNAHCEACELDLSHARADDGPAYLTILIVGHLAALALHIMWTVWEPSPFVLASTISLTAIALSLFLLPRFKGAIIGFQWAKGVHGF